MTERLLAIAAHQDDETFWFGKILAKSVREGMEVHLLIVTDGAKGTGSVKIEEEALCRIRKEECLSAAQVLGIRPENVKFLDHPDKSITLLQIPDVVRDIEKHIEEIDPVVVLTDNEANTTKHGDHILTAFASYWAVKRMYEKEYGLNIWDEQELPYHSPFSFESFLTYNLPPFPERYLDKWGRIEIASEKIITAETNLYASLKEEAASRYKSQDHLVKHFDEVDFWAQNESFIERINRSGRKISFPVPMPLELGSYRLGQK